MEGREASLDVLASPELLRCIVDLIEWDCDCHRRRDLFSICLVSSAIHAACAPILYQKVAITKNVRKTVAFPQVEGLVAALGRKRGYGQCVRHIILKNIAPSMASRILALCPNLESLAWSPGFHSQLSLPLQLPVLKSPGTLREFVLINRSDYPFSDGALESWFSLTSKLTSLRTVCSAASLQAVLASVGHQLTKLAHDPQDDPDAPDAPAYGETEWQGIFGLIPDIKHVEILGWCNETIFGALPDSVCTLKLHSINRLPIVLLLQRLADATWLPNLTETPSFDKYEYDIGFFNAAVVTDEEMVAKIVEAILGLSARPFWVCDDRWWELVYETSLCTFEAQPVPGIHVNDYIRPYEQFFEDVSTALDNEYGWPIRPTAAIAKESMV